MLQELLFCAALPAPFPTHSKLCGFPLAQAPGAPCLSPQGEAQILQLFLPHSRGTLEHRCRV